MTSLHGAAWHDIVNVVGRRYPLADLVLSPAQVQGAGAAESIVRALQDLLNEVSVDVVIIARGGGASDDLSAFNDERVVRAVFASRVPVVTGVGHATDRTLVEDVADVHAPTPSAAAELCVPSIEGLHERLRSLESRLIWSFAVRRADAEAPLRAAAPANGIMPSPKATRAQNRYRDRRDSHAEALPTRSCAVGSEPRRRADALIPAAVLRAATRLQRPEMACIFSVIRQNLGRIVALLGDGAVESTVETALPSSPHAAISQ